MEEDAIEAAALSQFEAGVEVFEEIVDADIGAEAEEVEGGILPDGVIDGGDEGGVFEEVAVADGLGDAGGFLIDDTAGADVLVADFGVSHGSFWEADLQSAGVDEGVGIEGYEVVFGGMLSEEDGVALVPFGGWTVAPTVTDDENDRAFFDSRHEFLSRAREPEHLTRMVRAGKTREKPW